MPSYSTVSLLNYSHITRKIGMYRKKRLVSVSNLHSSSGYFLEKNRLWHFSVFLTQLPTWPINHNIPLQLVNAVNHLMLANFPDLTHRIPAASIPRGPARSDMTCKHPVAMSRRSCAANPRKCSRPLLQERQEKAKPSFWIPSRQP
jgi:hypothetical protein